MTLDADSRLTVLQRRRAMRLAYWNGAVWAVGNGLTSTMLVVYLAMEFDVPGIGLGISLILAAPHLAGLLRVSAPAMIGRLAERKRFCIATFLFSAAVLFALPFAVAPGWLPSGAASLYALVVLWCVYHLLQYLATVALWSWLADLVPLRIRGRFIGRRERWMVAGQALAMLDAGLFVWGWRTVHPAQPRWIAYSVPAALGACFMLAAVVPLMRIPRVVTSHIVRSGASLRSLIAPLADSRFLRLLLFGCWLSAANGISQLPQNLYPYRVLGIGLFVMLALKTGMRLGQLTAGPWLGRAADRLGNRPLMIACLLLVAQGPLFYLAATPLQPWWLVGAWMVWVAWVGLNVCLPNLMLKLSPGQSNTPYIATFFALTGLCYAASTILGGVLYDWYRHTTFLLFGSVVLDYYRCVFLFGWFARCVGVLLLLVVIEGPHQGRRSHDCRRRLRRRPR